MSLSSSDSKQFVERYLQALSGGKKTPELVARFVSDPALAEHIVEVEAAFPEYEVIAEEIIAERNLVAVRATFRGVHRGAFAGIPPTGREAAVPFMIIYRIDRDRIVEHWRQFDGAALVAQLQSPVLEGA